MKGIIFTFDAVFALFLVAAIVPVFFLISSSATSDSVNQKLSLQSEDVINTISAVKVSQMINEPVMSDLYGQGILTEQDFNLTLVEFISKLWASNNVSDNNHAQNITGQIIERILPPNVRWSFSIEDEDIYNSGSVIKRSNVVSKRVVSGFHKGNQSSGYVASVFLTNISGKSASSYFFFGGFVGQGNISFNVSDIAPDATISYVYMEMDAGTNFTLFINGNACGAFNKTFSGLAADNWTINSTGCLSNILPGLNNTFLINFAGSDKSRQYVGGGFFKIAYKTQLFSTQVNITRYYIPGIAGAINYYDSFYIPGNLSSMNIHLEFFSPSLLSMIINNVTVFSFTGNNTTSQIIDVSDGILKTMLNYSKISRSNNLIRLGAVKQTEGNASTNVAIDAILVTSTSGEMGNCDIRNGTNVSLCGQSGNQSGNVTRLVAAKASDLQLATIILNATINRVGNLAYHNNINNDGSMVELTSNLSIVTAAINGMGLQGASQRCYACGIDEARRRLIPSNATVPSGALSPTGPGSNYNKTRIIVLMSDGNPNFCDNDDDAVGSFNQNCGSSTSRQQAIDQACLTGNNSAYSPPGSKLKIYTIAFGTNINNSTLVSIANCTGGKFYQSSNYTELINIYKSIGEEALNISFTQQVVNITGVADSSLYRNSYIDYQYAKDGPQVEYQEIQIDQETSRFSSCNGVFFVPPQLRVIDTKVTSYSSSFWTSLVTLNYTDITVFNISLFGGNLTQLGDPFKIQIPVQLIMPNNNITVRISDNLSSLSSNCSTSNRVIYSATLKASAPFGSIFPKASGGRVLIYYDGDYDGLVDGNATISLGSNLPGFNQTVRTVDQLDNQTNALDNALVRFLYSLDFNQTAGISGTLSNPINVPLSNIDINAVTTGGVPYAWGPLDVKMSIGV